MSKSEHFWKKILSPIYIEVVYTYDASDATDQKHGISQGSKTYTRISFFVFFRRLKNEKEGENKVHFLNQWFKTCENVFFYQNFYMQKKNVNKKSQ